MKKIRLSLLIVITCFNSAHANVRFSEEVTICNKQENLQECIDNSPKKVIRLSEGVHNTNGITLESNTTFYIPKNSILRLSDSAVLNDKAFGGDANFVIGSIGEQDNPIHNVNIIIDGEIDGNKNIHSYDKGGVEGIDWKWVQNSTISGHGTIHSANGDGIDLDAVNKIRISDLTVKDNGDSGIHFGSPRPIAPSTNNVVFDVTSINNGFRNGRSGFDLSWPNPKGGIYVNCIAIDNYRNFEIEAEGGVVYSSKSITTGKVVAKDDFGGADYAFINGIDVTKKNIISKKTKVLIKRDIMKLLGIEYPRYLDNIDY